MARLAEWREKTAACRRSGKPVIRWCQEQRVSAKTYHRWEREVLAEAGQVLAVQECRESPAFVEVRAAIGVERAPGGGEGTGMVAARLHKLTAQQYRWLMEGQLDGQLSLLFNEAEAYAVPPGAKKTTQNAGAQSCQSCIAAGGVLHLRLRKLREERYQHACLKNAEGAVCNSRQLCLAGGHRAHHSAEIRDGQPAVPAGAGVGPCGAEALAADHEQLGAAGGGAADAGQRTR